MQIEEEIDVGGYEQNIGEKIGEDSSKDSEVNSMDFVSDGDKLIEVSKILQSLKSNKLPAEPIQQTLPTEPTDPIEPTSQEPVSRTSEPIAINEPARVGMRLIMGIHQIMTVKVKVRMMV